MSEETKKAIEELVKATEGNDIAKAFLRGYKSGLDTIAADAAIRSEAVADYVDRTAKQEYRPA